MASLAWCCSTVQIRSAIATALCGLSTFSVLSSLSSGLMAAKALALPRCLLNCHHKQSQYADSAASMCFLLKLEEV